MRRHLLKWWLRMDNEDHLAHQACNIMFAIAYRDRIKDGDLPSELDDRPNEKSRKANLTSTKKNKLVARCCSAILTPSEAMMYHDTFVCPKCGDPFYA
jgi:predicted RNA-binding Zn-ribbon protein involved in translation (DUF1610 family)